MNIIHIRYAVEVAKYGSINKASEVLGMAQPNISRAIKDLEADVGIVIFDRSAKGMKLTPEGKEFISKSQNILSQLNDLEYMFRGGTPNRQKLSVSAPRAAYIAEAFAHLSKKISGDSAEIVLDETSTYNTIKKVTSGDCKLGIIRYEEAAKEYFTRMLDSSGLIYEDVTTFDYVIITHKDSKLAAKKEICDADLRDLIQITHNNPYQATLSASDNNKVEQRVSADKRIYVLDTAAQLEILAENSNTFMWISPAPQTLLDRYNLVQFECIDKKRAYKDVFVYRKDYSLTDLDKEFFAELRNLAKLTYGMK